jgi:myotubularin-related protein 3/4
MDGSPPASMWMVHHRAESFPKPVLEKEDDKLTIPFNECKFNLSFQCQLIAIISPSTVAGEGVKYLGTTDDGVLALSNYRLFLLKTTSAATEVSIPLGLIESAQIRDLFHLFINCKDASTIQCSFATSEQCAEWQRRITISVGVPESLEKLFAFPFHAWLSDMPQQFDNEWTGRLQKFNNYDDDFRKEVSTVAGVVVLCCWCASVITIYDYTTQQAISN